MSDMRNMQIDDKHLIIDLKVGNNKKVLENLFDANRANIAISNENKRLNKNSRLREDVYGVKEEHVDTDHDKRNFLDRPDQMNLGLAQDVARDLSSGNIRSREEMGLGGYIPPNKGIVSREERPLPETSYGQIMNKAD